MPNLLSFNLQYLTSVAGLSAERTNLTGPLVLERAASHVLKQTINHLRYVVITIPKSEVDLNTIYLERKCYVAKYRFEGIITAIKDIDDSTFEITIHEPGWHFTRRIFKIEDTQKEYSIKLPVASPISKYLFEDNVNDSIGTNHGSVTGTPTYVIGKSGKAFEFDGSRYITLANEANFDRERTQKFSIGFWIYIEAGFDETDAIFAKSNDLGGITSAGYGVKITNDVVNLELNDGTNRISKKTPALGFGAWKRVIVVYLGDSTEASIKCYVNGALNMVSDVAGTLTGSILNNLAAVIGAESDGGRILGKAANKVLLDDVRFWPVALTNEEIAADFIGDTFSAYLQANILNSANVDMPADLQWVLGEDIPSSIVAEFDLKYKNYYEFLQLLAKNGIADIWFEGKKVYFGKKGKTIELDPKEQYFKNFVSAIDLDKYGNIVNVVGAKEGGQAFSAIESITNDKLQYNYERVVSNSNLGSQDAVDSVAARVIDEYNSLDPDVKLSIPLAMIEEYSINIGDVFKIASDSITQSVKGFYRVVQLDIEDTKSTAKLQFSQDGKFIPRLMDSTDIFKAILDKIQAIELSK